MTDLTVYEPSHSLGTGFQNLHILQLKWWLYLYVSFCLYYTFKLFILRCSLLSLLWCIFVQATRNVTEQIRQILAENCLSGFAWHSQGTECRFVHITQSLVFEAMRSHWKPEGSSKIIFDVSGVYKSSWRSFGGWKAILSILPMTSDLTRLFKMLYGGVQTGFKRLPDQSWVGLHMEKHVILQC